MSLLYKALRKAANQEQRKDKPQPPNLKPSASKAGGKMRLPGPAWLTGGASIAVAVLAVVIFWPTSEVVMAPKQMAEADHSPPAATVEQTGASVLESVPAEPEATPAGAGTVDSSPVAPVAIEETAKETKVERPEPTPAPTAAPRRTAPIPAAPKASDAVVVTDESTYFRESHVAARDHLRGGQTQLALSIYDDLLGRQPAELAALMGRATALRRLGRGSASIRAYEEVLNHYPDEIVALTELLGLLGQQSPERALKRLHRLHTVNPGHGPVAAQIGLLYAQVGNLQQGIRYMTEATQLQPGNAAYRLNLAVLLDRSGDMAAALRAYEVALDMAPGAGDVDIPVDTVRRRVGYLRAN